MILLALSGCVAPDKAAVDTAGDTAADTDPVDTDSGDTDSGDTADTDSGETGDTDTGDTAPAPLAGTFSVEGTWRGAPFSVACTEADGDAVFVRYWSDAVGNVAGHVGCYRGEDPRPWAAVMFSRGATGEWTAPGDATWQVGDATGSWIHGEGTTAWALAFTRFERVDLDTYALAGTLSATWTGEDGGGAVTGTFDALLPCSGACP